MVSGGEPKKKKKKIILGPSSSSSEYHDLVLPPETLEPPTRIPENLFKIGVHALGV